MKRSKMDYDFQAAHLQPEGTNELQAPVVKRADN